MKPTLFLFAALVILQGCIGDDIIFDTVDPVIRIDNPLDTLEVGTTYQLDYTYLNNVGQEETVNAIWESSAPDIINVSASGLLEALTAGDATITVAYMDSTDVISESITVNAGAETVVNPTDRSGTIQTTSSYTLEGDFTIADNGNGGIDIVIADNYRASSSLPGLYIYLTNNENTTVGALELQKVDVFQGAHTYTVDGVGLNDYSHILYFCKPFNVKVGDGEIN